MRRLRLAGLIAAVALPSLTCDTSTTVRTSSLTRTYITDSPFPYYRVARVDLHIVSVSASLSPDTAATSAGFVTLATPDRTINVLELQNGLHAELGAVTIPSGDITAVRMIIDTDLSSITLKNGRVLRGSTTPGIDWQSSAGRAVLNALVAEQISVPREGALIVLDYDVGQAFIPKQELDPASTDSGFIFSPVLRAVDALRSGWILGVVREQSLSGNVVLDASLRLYLGRPGEPESTWDWLGTAKTDAEGRFRFASLMRSAYWAQNPIHDGKTYIVTADPPPGSGRARGIMTNISVSAATGTDIGTIVLP